MALIDVEHTAYLTAVAHALEEGDIPAQYLTPFCSECEIEQTAVDNTDHIVMRIDADPHNIAVVIACEGYWMINPAAVGIERSEWQDWTKLPEDISADEFKD